MVSKGVKKFFGVKSKKSKKAKESVPVDETAVAAEETTTEPIEATEPEPSAPAEEEVREGASADAEPTEGEEGEKAEASKSADGSTADAEADADVEETPTEDSAIKYSRIDTLHADVTVPKTAKSGDILDLEHDGPKQIRIPSGVQGENITVKMVSSPQAEPSTGYFCGCA